MRTKVTVCIHEKRVRPVHPSTGGRLCLLAVVAHILQLQLQVSNTLAGRLGLHAGVLRIFFFIIKSTIEILFFLLKWHHLLENVSALIFGRRLIPNRLSMLRPKALNPTLKSFPLGNQLRGQRPRSNLLGEGRYLTSKFPNSIQQNNIYIHTYI